MGAFDGTENSYKLVGTNTGLLSLASNKVTSTDTNESLENSSNEYPLLIQRSANYKKLGNLPKDEVTHYVY